MVSASNSQSTNPELPFAGTIFAVFIIIYEALHFAIGVISLLFPENLSYIYFILDDFFDLKMLYLHSILETAKLHFMSQLVRVPPEMYKLQQNMDSKS
jgi:hypothetical protein